MSEPENYGGIQFGLQADAGRGVITVGGAIEDGRYRFEVDEDGERHGPYEGLATALPLQLADMVGLGPRDAPPADAEVLFVEEIEHEGRAGLTESWDDEQKAGTALEGEHWLLWSAFAAWGVDGEPFVNGITVADGGEFGQLAVVLDQEDGTVIVPCTAAEIWVALCGLLPRTADFVAVEAVEAG